MDFFNQDPVEYFRNHHAFKGEFAKIVRDPKAQETLRQSFKQVADAIKMLIVAYEDFWQGRAPKDGLKTLREAVEALDKLIEIKVSYNMGVSGAGIVRYTPTNLKAKSQLNFILPSAHTLIANKVVNLKYWLDQYQEHLPIGVCRYEKCRKFFMKKRKHARFCSEAHATYMRMRIYRRSLQRKKTYKDTPK